MRKIALLIALLCTAGSAHAAGLGSVDVTGFADVYWGFDPGATVGTDRNYTTQALRSREFGLNYGVVTARYSSPEGISAAFGLHAGSYVESNYAAEPEAWRPVAEAWVQYEFAERWTVKAGIFPSHIGAETALSIQNIALTRSLIADYSPYYETGVSLSHSADKFSFSVLLLNGWQNIRETNADKAVGTALAVQASENISVAWNTFTGNEQPEGRPSLYRVFNNFIGTYRDSSGVEVAASFDLGVQEVQEGEANLWYGCALLGRVPLSERLGIGMRVERYSDPKGVIVTTSPTSSFVCNGASVNLDFRPQPALALRAEVRYLRAEEAVFNDRGNLSNNNISFALSAGVLF